MRLSAINLEDLSDKQKYDLVIKDIFYGTVGLRKSKLKTAIVVLGAKSDSIKERMLTAIELLKKGYGSHIIVTDCFEPAVGTTHILEKDESEKDTQIRTEQVMMSREIADIFAINYEKMLYTNGDSKTMDPIIKSFDKYILVTLLPNVRRAVQRCKKCFPSKRFTGCATMREFAEWNFDLEDTKEKYSSQIENEASALIEYAKSGDIADMNVDFIYEGGKANE